MPLTICRATIAIFWVAIFLGAVNCGCSYPPSPFTTVEPAPAEDDGAATLPNQGPPEPSARPDSKIAADHALEYELTAWGPLEPLGPGESGRRLLNRLEPVALDAYVEEIQVRGVKEILHASGADFTPKPEDRYAVRIHLNAAGLEKYLELRTIADQWKKETQAEVVERTGMANASAGEVISFSDKPPHVVLGLGVSAEQLTRLMQITGRSPANQNETE